MSPPLGGVLRCVGGVSLSLRRLPPAHVVQGAESAAAQAPATQPVGSLTSSTAEKSQNGAVAVAVAAPSQPPAVLQVSTTFLGTPKPRRMAWELSLIHI